MNGIEKITDRIAAQAEAQEKAMNDRAETQARAVYAGYQAAADQDYKDALEKGRRDAEQRVERMGSVSQLEARKLQLAAKQEMLEKAFQRAYEKLLALPEEEYGKLLVSLAVKASETGDEALIFSQTDRSRWGKKVVLAANEALAAQGKNAALTLSEESRDFRGGLYLQKGQVETNCTFAALIRLQRDRSSRAVAEILFN